MIRYLIVISILLFTLVGWGQKTSYNGVGRWRTHFPYKDVKQIQEAGDFIYVLPEKGFFTLHKPSGEVTVYSKVNGFSDIDVALMRFIEPLNKMVFVYTNGNIDILDMKTETIINLPDVLRKSILGEKVFFDLQYFEGKAYLSSSLGIILIDLNKLEIRDSYQNIGPFGTVVSVYSTARYKDSLYAGTSKGILRAHATGSNLSDFQSWENVKPGFESKMLRVFDNKLYAVNDSVYQNYDGFKWSNVSGSSKQNVVSIELCHNKLIESHWGGFLILKPGGIMESIPEKFISFGIIDINNLIWTGGEGLGLMNINSKGEYGYLGINGPNGLTTHSIAGWRDEIWVTSGGPGFVYGPTFNGSGYYHFKDNRWENRPDTPAILRQMFDFTAIAINKATGETFLGSHGTGIARLQNGKFIERFDEHNSTLQKQANIFTIVPGLGFDSKGNLWASNFDTDSCLSVRFTNGQFKAFKLFKTRFAAEMAIDDLDQKWVTTPRFGNGIVVFKEASNGQPQKERILTKGKGAGDLPSTRINALVVDKDNELWIGTDEGLAVFFNPARAFELEEDAQRIIVEQNGVVGYLMGTETINDICIDGANRKWMATNNGAFLVEKDGTSVLKHFTVDNSPLPSNIIKSVGVNGVSGEVFFGTQNGLISYGGNATDAEDTHGDEVKIYPNPVFENYDGDITIQGLPDYATVKITDVSGRIIYETLSNGGIATWNGKMFNGKKPQTGIYLIFSSNKEDGDSKVSKLLIVN